MSEKIAILAYPVKKFLAKMIRMREPETAFEISDFSTDEVTITKFVLKHFDLIPDYDKLIQARLVSMKHHDYIKTKTLQVRAFNKNVENTRRQYFKDIISKNLIHRLVLKAIMYYYPDELKGCVKLRERDHNIKSHKEGTKVFITGVIVIDKVNDKIIAVLKDLINKDTLPLPIEKCIIRVLKLGSNN